MNEAQIRTIDQIQLVLDGTKELNFTIEKSLQQQYAWIASVLRRFSYGALPRKSRGIILAYLQRFSGYQRAQINRLVARWLRDKTIAARYRPPAHAFAQRFTSDDIQLLAEVDSAMGGLSGAATVHTLKRQFKDYGDARFKRLSTISVSHLYNSCLRYLLPKAAHSPRPPPSIAYLLVFARLLNPTTNLDTSASTACIKVIKIASRGCITLMRWIV